MVVGDRGERCEGGSFGDAGGFMAFHVCEEFGEDELDVVHVSWSLRFCFFSRPGRG